MKKTFALLLSICALIALFAFSACDSEEASDPTFGEEQTEEKTSEVTTLELSGNPTTGYEWTIDESSYDSDIIAVSDPMYEQDEVADDEDAIVGAGGVYRIEVKPLKAGTTELVCNYARSWEDTPMSTYTCKITIDDDLKMTYTEETVDNDEYEVEEADGEDVEDEETQEE